MNDDKVLEFKQDLKNIEAKVIQDRMYDYIEKRLAAQKKQILSIIEIENIGFRKAIMQLQIRLQAIEKLHLVEKDELDKYQQSLLYPDPRGLFCPKCYYHKFKGSEATDEHDTYLMLKCGECGYQYSPSHD